MVLASCGSKQKTVQEKLEELHLDQHDIVKTESEIKADVSLKNNVKESIEQTATSKKKTFTPIDHTKPSSVTDSNGKTTVLNNASLVEEESTDNSKIDKETQTDLQDKSQKTDKSDSSKDLKLDSQSGSYDMNLNKKGSPDWTWLWMLILIIVVFVVLWLYKKFNVKSYVTSFFKK